MAFNISGFFQNIVSGSGGMDSQSLENVQADRGGVTSSGAVTSPALAAMLAGDTLTGTVSSVSNQQVTLTLPDGQNILAKLAAEMQLQAGQTMTFIVQQNTGDFIALKPLFGDAQQMVLVQKALEAAGIAYNESNAELVAHLLEQNMPVDSFTISEMMKNIQKFPDANFDTIANLVKLHMPVTAENIQQFEAYTHYEHNMSQQLNNLPDVFAETLTGMINNPQGDVKETAAFLRNITEILYSGMPEGDEAIPVSEYMREDSRNALAKELINVFGKGAEDVAGQIKSGNAV